MFRNDEAAFVLLIPALIYWFVIGTFATGEPEVLSARVKRQLPESFLGRMFTNWFFPGPGRGYLFAVANYATMCLAVVVLFTMILPRASRPIDPERNRLPDENGPGGKETREPRPFAFHQPGWTRCSRHSGYSTNRSNSPRVKF